MPSPQDAGPDNQTPFIPASKNVLEISVKALILGIVLAVVLSGANAYLGLFAGMTVSASIPAAIISMALLRLFKNRSVLENNIVQTGASAGESLAAGVVFTFPALVLMGAWTDFNYWETTIIAALGGLLGVLFTVPLRRALIVDKPLKFPEGVATAELLKSGEKVSAGAAWSIILGTLIGALFKLGATGFHLWSETVETAKRVGGTLTDGVSAKATSLTGGSIVFFGASLSPALIGVGYIVGLNIALLVCIGGALNWYVAIPITASDMEWPTYEVSTYEEWRHWSGSAIAGQVLTAAKGDAVGVSLVNAPMPGFAFTPEPEWHDFPVQPGSDQAGQAVSADTWANTIWSSRTRYLGVGAMVIGGLWALIRLWRSLIRGVMSGVESYREVRRSGSTTVKRTERDTPMQWIMIALLVSVIPIYFIFVLVTNGLWGISAFMAIIMLIAGFLFSAVAAYMAGLVGSSNNPISGVTIATLLFAALLLLAVGMVGSDGARAAVLIAAVVCCAAAIGGDNMQDLKAGHILGATPWKLQIMQFVGVLAAAFFMAPILNLLLKAYGIGDITVPGQEPLAAPQASLMQSVAQGVFEGGLPWNIIFMGMVLAAIVIALDLLCEWRNFRFRLPVLAVAVGVYLPVELSIPMLAGGLISAAVHPRLPDEGDEMEGEMKANLMDMRQGGERNGLLFAAGLITGEALLGIILAIPIVIYKGNPLDLTAMGGTAADTFPLDWIGIVLFVLIMIMLVRVATRGLWAK